MDNTNRKKILILGAGDAQLNLLNTAQELGYYAIVCDMRSEMSASKLADQFYQINYMNREVILEIAKKEKIDGVISNSEPAMLNVAWLSQKLGLPGNTEESIKNLLSKSKFRDIQKKVRVFSPKHCITDSVDELVKKIKNMKLPVIIKPAESSGTRGTTKLDSFDKDQIIDAFKICSNFSRNNFVTAEEYVEMQDLRVNDADVFVIGDEILWDGWLWEDRSADTPMLPMTEIFPMALPEKDKQLIRKTVEKIIRISGVRLGEFNVETYFTNDQKVFVIEINPRQAGNYIPQLIEQHTGVSLTKLLVSTAVGDMSYYEKLKNFKRQCNYVTLQVVFGKQEGIFQELYIAPELRPYVKWINQTAKSGDKIVKGINASEAIAFVDMQFDDYETQHRYTDEIEKYIYPIMKK